MYYLYNLNTNEPYIYYGNHGDYVPVYVNVESAASYLKFLGNNNLTIKHVDL